MQTILPCPREALVLEVLCPMGSTHLCTLHPRHPREGVCILCHHSPAPGTASLISYCLLSQLTVVFDSFEECSSAASNLTLLAASLPQPQPLLSSMCTVPCPHPDIPSAPSPSPGPGLAFTKVAMTRAQVHGKHLTRGTMCWLWRWSGEGKMCTQQPGSTSGWLIVSKDCTCLSPHLPLESTVEPDTSVPGIAEAQHQGDV